MKNSIKNLTLSAIFLDLGLLLPFLTGQIPQIGNFLLPMHLPVFLCGLICNWKYGLFVGAITPLIRSFLFGMPTLHPKAIAMSFELATYGLVVGLIYNKCFSKKNLSTMYIALITAMICGRIIAAIAKIILYGIAQNKFSWTLFISTTFINAIPGIILQLILIPLLVSLFNKTKFFS